jgi:hypothetical protein
MKRTPILYLIPSNATLRMARRADMSREKGRGAILESTGSYISLVLLGRVWMGDITRGVGGVERVKGLALAKWACTPPSATWAENTILTE